MLASQFFYSQLHDYEYRIYCNVEFSKTVPKVAPAWAKVILLRRLLDEAVLKSLESLFLLIDSDAMFQQPDVSISYWLEKNELDFKSMKQSIFVAYENAPNNQAKFEINWIPRERALNTGVSYFYVNPANTERSEKVNYSCTLFQ